MVVLHQPTDRFSALRGGDRDRPDGPERGPG
jgi:hypothetical protein